MDVLCIGGRCTLLSLCSEGKTITVVGKLVAMPFNLYYSKWLYVAFLLQAQVNVIRSSAIHLGTTSRSQKQSHPSYSSA